MRELTDGVTVVPRTRRDGKQVWLVSGWVGGQRIQIERVDRAEAEVKAAELNETVTAAGCARRPVMTALTAEQLQDAESARAILPPWATQVQAAEFFRQHFRPVVPQKLRTMIDRYIDSRRREAKNSETTLGVLEPVLNTLPHVTGANSTADLTPAAAKRWVFAPGLSARSQRDRYDYLQRFARWLIAEKALLQHPLANIDRPKWEWGPPTILSIAQLGRLLQCAWQDPEGPEMVPFFAMATLSGARPFELRRAHESHWCLDVRPAVFEVHRAKGIWRSVELPANLRTILKECVKRGIPLAYFSKRKFNRIRRAAGLFDLWDNDILRHSSASYIYARAHDIRWLEANYGNSEKVLFRHYIRRNVRKPEARAFAQLRIDFTQPSDPVAATVRAGARPAARTAA